MTTWIYAEQYEKLLETLAKDSQPWRPVFNIPKDGTKIYFKCGVGMTSLDFKEGTLYDVGYWEEFSEFWKRNYDFDEGGEFNTEFGNCEEILGWKYVEEPE